MMTMKEEYDEAVKYANVGGDYKDYAEETFRACLSYAESSKASEAFKKWITDAPNGLDCPRAWLDYLLPDDGQGTLQPLTGKWEDAYVQELGILEHCDEVLTIHRARAVAKAERRMCDVEWLGTALANEMADLYLILDKRYAGSSLVTERSKKFRP